LLNTPSGKPAMIEYPYGAGRVIVSSLTFCTPSETNSQGDALDNLLKYARFYFGTAQTPAPTVTSTSTPTPTITGQATPTATRTRTPLRTPTSPDTPTGTETPTPDDTAAATPADTATPTPNDTATPAPMVCAGDCDGGMTVVISELIECVNIALGANLSACPACSSNGQTVEITDLVAAVNNALNGCPPPR
jgi:hypothetical protein